jgi:hypothetical protein
MGIVQGRMTVLRPVAAFHLTAEFWQSSSAATPEHSPLQQNLEAHRVFVILCASTVCPSTIAGKLRRLKVADYNRDVETLTIREAKCGRMRHVTLTGEAPELSGALWGCQ